MIIGINVFDFLHDHNDIIVLTAMAIDSLVVRKAPALLVLLLTGVVRD